MLLSTAFFPPVEWFALVARDMDLATVRDSGSRTVVPSVVYLEACENYRKQTWRNRCRFLCADGPASLSVPVVHERERNNIPIREIMVDWDSDPWLLRAERTLATAYGPSPFFDYYKDRIFSILESRPKLLYDLNLEIIDFFLGAFGIRAEIRPTSVYIPSSGSEAGEYGEDYRDVLSPKQKNSVLHALGLGKPYYQSFPQPDGFVDGLSAMDLLFNEGPESIFWLKKIQDDVSAVLEHKNYK